MNDPGRNPYQFELSGGALCLDFANTLEDRPRAEEEHLHDFVDVLAWAEQADAITPEERTTLARQAQSDAAGAEATFQRAVDLREMIFRVFARLAEGQEPDEEDLSGLNRELAVGLSHLEVRREGESFGWGWRGLETDLERPLWPIVRSAARLLTSEEASSVRECASEVCSWLFVDRSRNRCRRWCDMSTCGNRAKARRHYRRKKESSPIKLS